MKLANSLILSLSSANLLVPVLNFVFQGQTQLRKIIRALLFILKMRRITLWLGSSSYFAINTQGLVCFGTLNLLTLVTRYFTTIAVCQYNTKGTNLEQVK